MTISGTHKSSVACLRTGMPRPSLRTDTRPASSISTSIVLVPSGSRWRLSSALTRISSKILYSPELNCTLRHTMHCASSSYSHMLFGTTTGDPMYIPGRASTCSCGVSRW